MITTVFAYGQDEDRLLVKEISKHLKANSMDEITKYFASELQLSLLEQDGIYTKSEAIKIVTTFFENYPTDNYQEKHSGDSPDGNIFSIGEIKKEEEVYRVYFVVNDNHIQEFCVEID